MTPTVAAEWALEPFPHTIVDGLWPAADIEAAEASFPPAHDPRWITYPQPGERGKRCGPERMWAPAVTHMMDQMRSGGFRAWLEDLAGAGGLVPDTLGGGMHMTGAGGRLAMHRDFNTHPELGLERRLNVLVFLNPQWEKEWGGVLYLGENREVEILPLANRTAVFECGPVSWHGHPEPIQGAHWRKSLACYWYAPPRGSLSPHSTVWQGR